MEGDFQNKAGDEQIWALDPDVIVKANQVLVNPQDLIRGSIK